MKPFVRPKLGLFNTNHTSKKQLAWGIVLLSAGTLVMPITGQGFPIANTGEGFSVIVSNSGDVIATYQGNSAAYSNDLYLDSPTGTIFIFNNHHSPIGSSKNLGSFTPGTELKFRLYVNNTGMNFFTGDAGRNPDNHVHAKVQESWQSNETLVSFEDLYGGPFDYNDLSFSFTNVAATNGYTVYGTLFGKNGKPLAGAIIHLGEHTAITDKNGNWSISDLLAGDYQVVASKGDNIDECGVARILDNGQYQQQVDSCTVTYGDNNASVIAIWQSVNGNLQYVDTVTVEAFDAKFQEGRDYKIVDGAGEYVLEGIDDEGNTTSKVNVVRIQ